MTERSKVHTVGRLLCYDVINRLTGDALMEAYRTLTRIYLQHNPLPPAEQPQQQLDPAFDFRNWLTKR
jgi:hypothetical protein